jgi:hypothetical protein
MPANRLPLFRIKYGRISCPLEVVAALQETDPSDKM